jgi:hypothetical protein
LGLLEQFAAAKQLERAKVGLFTLIRLLLAHFLDKWQIIANFAPF